MTAIQVKDQYGSRLLLDISAIESVYEVSERSTGIVMRSGKEHRTYVSYDDLMRVLVDEGYGDVVDFTEDPNIEPSEEPSEELSAEDKAALDDLMREKQPPTLSSVIRDDVAARQRDDEIIENMLNHLEERLYRLEAAEREGRLEKTVVSEAVWSALSAVRSLAQIVRKTRRQ